MSETGLSQSALQTQWRYERRSLKTALKEAEGLFEEDEESIPRLEIALKDLSSQLEKHFATCTDLVDYIETEGKTKEEVNAEEDAFFEEHAKFMSGYRKLRGQLAVLASNRFKREEAERAASLQNKNPRDSLIFNATNDHLSHMRLPKIELVKFDGDIRKFADWASLMEELILNSPLYSDREKLYYLKNSLTGEATEYVLDQNLERNSIDVIWCDFKRHFNNKRKLITCHFSDIIDLDPIRNDVDARSAIRKISAATRGLTGQAINAEAMSPFICYLVSRKLSPSLRREWEKSISDNSKHPSMKEMEDFLVRNSFALEILKENERESNVKRESTKGAGASKSKSVHVVERKLETKSNNVSQTSSIKCRMCGEAHFLACCKKYLELSIPDRFAKVKSWYLCLNCLRPGHISQECHSSTCRKCSLRHNTTLHRETSKRELPGKGETSALKEEEPKSATVAATVKPNGVACLPTAIVRVLIDNRSVKARVLLDACSEATMVTETFVRKHKIPTHQCFSQVTGVTPGVAASHTACTMMLSYAKGEFKLQIEASVFPKIPYEVKPELLKVLKARVPEISLSEEEISHNSIDILIGVQYVYQCLLSESKQLDGIHLQMSHFGWVASGVLESNKSSRVLSCNLVADIQSDLQKFWEVEEAEATYANSTEQDLCESHFLANFTRLENGKFSVRLPFKLDPKNVANTYPLALAALRRNEVKLKHEVCVAYQAFMQEYLELGHMQLVPWNEIGDQPVYYLPHHAVLRPSSMTTKLRVVFNASARNCTGCSLNEALMKGPSIQPELFDNLVSFRCYPYAYTADISKMYRCIEVAESDRNMQRIIWRDNEELPIQVYRLKTITYGMSPASYMATKCLQILGEEIKEQFPNAAKAIQREFYMDDLLTGEFTLEDAIAKQRVIHETLAAAKFPLVKYASNNSEILSSLEVSLVDKKKTVEFNNADTLSLLGLSWTPRTDQLGVSIKCLEVESQIGCTKRTILSFVSKIFEPLGILSPVTVTGKILIQDLWREELKWDDQVSTVTQKRFDEYRKNLLQLTNFSLDRPYPNYGKGEHQLVGFSDASESAYAAVIYLRTEINNKATSSIICSKTRIAPIKALTIPRLELRSLVAS